MGLGPNGSKLLERLGRPTEPGGDTIWIQIDQQERGEARMQARMRYQQKHKTPKKPEAPVEAGGGKGAQRNWLWVGESIPSKQMFKDMIYYAADIRAAGFKLPKLQKQKKKGKGKVNESL